MKAKLEAAPAALQCGRAPTERSSCSAWHASGGLQRDIEDYVILGGHTGQSVPLSTRSTQT